MMHDELDRCGIRPLAYTGSRRGSRLGAAIQRALPGIVVAVLVGGCGDPVLEKRHYQEMLIREPVTARSAPPTKAATSPESGPMTAAQLPPGSMAPMALTWQAPAGWEEKEASAPRIATFLIGADQKVEVSVTSFPGDVGGLLANVTRWAGQLGLSPSTEQATAVVEGADDIVTETGIPGKILNFDGLSGSGQASASSMRAAVLQAKGSSIFVKVTGPQSLLRAEHSNFVAFCTSIAMDDQP